MIDPDEGIKLLHHDLAKVREGAWMGLAKLPLGTEEKPFYLADGPAAVELIERLVGQLYFREIEHDMRF